MKIVGLELKNGTDRETTICFLTDTIETTLIVQDDISLMKKVDEIHPDIVAIGSPLSLPLKGNTRKAEDELSKRNLKFRIPKGMLAMEQLVMRGIELKSKFLSKGFLVIETFPNGFYDLIRVPRTNNYDELKRFLKIFHLNLERREYTQEELNAITSAFTGRLFLETKVEFLGDVNEGQIVLPRIISKM